METNKNNNIPAFPLIDEIGNYIQEGMSLRDYFAGKFLQGHIASEYYAGMNNSKENTKGVAMLAYSFADAMLEVREETES